MVRDSTFLDVPRVESYGIGNHPSSNSTGALKSASKNIVSIDTNMASTSSTRSKDTQVLNSKCFDHILRFIEDLEDIDNSSLLEIRNGSEGEEDEVGFL